MVDAIVVYQFLSCDVNLVLDLVSLNMWLNKGHNGLAYFILVLWIKPTPNTIIDIGDDTLVEIGDIVYTYIR